MQPPRSAGFRPVETVMAPPPIVDPPAQVHADLPSDSLTTQFVEEGVANLTTDERREMSDVLQAWVDDTTVLTDADKVRLTQFVNIVNPDI